MRTRAKHPSFALVGNRTTLREEAAQTTNLRRWDMDRVRHHPCLQALRYPIRITLIGLLSRRRDHPKMVRVERQNRCARSRHDVVNEVAHRPHLLTAEQRVR
jgi:hypothetical protein